MYTVDKKKFLCDLWPSVVRKRLFKVCALCEYVKPGLEKFLQEALCH